VGGVNVTPPVSPAGNRRSAGGGFPPRAPDKAGLRRNGDLPSRPCEGSAVYLSAADPRRHTCEVREVVTGG
jgi:hypothetical protein